MDAVFLTLFVMLSMGPYATRLGFYSDDWAVLGVLDTSRKSFIELLQRQYEFSASLRMRPTQVIYQAVLYMLFGLTPLGYHIVNMMVFIAMTLLLYLILRELDRSRFVAVAIPALYALLPNYSTDRFWFAAFGYALSMGCYFLSVYADLMAIRCHSLGKLIAWKLIALLGLLAAGFGYEIVLPLFLLNAILVWIQAKRLYRGGLTERLGSLGSILFIGSNFVMLAPVVLYKATTAQGIGLAGSIPVHILRLFIGSALMNYGMYGLGLPYAARWSAQVVAWPVLAMSVAVGLLMFAFLQIISRPGDGQLLPRWYWFRLGMVGLSVFALGYAIFLTTGRVSFSSTGIVNRIAIAGALGMAMSVVAVVGWFGSLFPAAAFRHFFACLIAIICMLCFLINNAFAMSWTTAWPEERKVLREIQTALPKLPSHSTLILHGVCPYIGSAIVFESYWDLAGALQVVYRDPTLKADVTSNDMVVKPYGLMTRIYGDTKVYPYGNYLILYDFQRKQARPIPDAQTAVEYFGNNSLHLSPGCPRGSPARGQVIFPADSLYDSLDARLSSLSKE